VWYRHDRDAVPEALRRGPRPDVATALACGPLDELLALHDELAALPAVADLHVQRRRAGLPDRLLLRTLAARGRPVHESLLPFGGRTGTPEVPP
jgi:hypothetical protein